MIAKTIALLVVSGAIIAGGYGVGRGMRVAVDTLSEDDNGSVVVFGHSRSNPLSVHQTNGGLRAAPWATMRSSPA